MKTMIAAALLMAAAPAFAQVAESDAHQNPQAMSDGAAVALIAAGMLIGGALYLSPTLLAFRRRHPQRMAILMTNVLLGWTFIGWCVACIWAWSAVREPAERG